MQKKLVMVPKKQILIRNKTLLDYIWVLFSNGIWINSFSHVFFVSFFD